MSISVHNISRHMMSVYLSTGNINFITWLRWCAPTYLPTHTAFPYKEYITTPVLLFLVHILDGCLIIFWQTKAQNEPKRSFWLAVWSTYHRNQRVEVGSPVKAVEILCEKQILRVTKKKFFFTLKKCMKKYTINIVKGNYLTNSQFHQWQKAKDSSENIKKHMKRIPRICDY